MKKTRIFTSLMRAIILLWIFLSTFYINAEGNIILHLKSGSQVVLPLDESPSILFEHGSITVGNKSYQISEVLKYTFSTTAAQNSAVINPQNITISDDGNIYISSFTDVSLIKIFDIRGIECQCKKSVIDNNLTINISGLHAGNYILSIGNESIKFTKK